MLRSQPLNPEAFQTCLTRKHDLVLVDTEDAPFYQAPSVRCDSCGTIETMVYTPTMEALSVAMEMADSAMAQINEQKFDETDPDTGFLVCLECGDGIGADLSADDVLTVEADSWRHYVEHRTEQGEPV